MRQSNLGYLPEFQCDEEDIKISDRSRLFSLEPIGSGTAHIEGLTSYLIRLAGAHSVSPKRLIRTEFARANPNIAKLTRSGFFRHNSRTINGPSSYARIFVDAARELTGLRTFRYMTMLPLEHLLPRHARGLLFQNVQWCPDCFDESKQNGQDAYRPLVWSFHHYTYCSIHKRKMSKHCPKCGKPEHVIPSYPSVAHCCHCGSWLGSSSRSESNPSSDDLWISTAIEDLVSNLKHIEENATETTLMSRINTLVQDVASGNQKEFCRRIGLKPWMVNAWNSGHIPGILQWFALSYGLNVTPSQLLCDGNMAPFLNCRKLRKIPRLFSYGSLKPPLSGTERGHIQRELEKLAAASDGSRSLSSIARDFDQPLPNLKEISPMACHLIQERYRTTRKQRSAEKLERERAQIKTIVGDLIKSGEYPGGGKVNKRLRRNGLALVRPALKQTYRDEIAKLRSGEFV